MEARLGNILEATVCGFIKTGKPVSSEWLYGHYNFGIKPAMIRLKLNELSESGYLEQPHHSAGRTPSDSGYEFFARRMMENHSARPTAHRAHSSLSNLLRQHVWMDFLERLSDDLGVLGVVSDQARGETYKRGLNDLVDNLEWESPDDLTEVIKDFEEIEQKLHDAPSLLGEETFRVFVGRQSPITRSRHLSVVVRECAEPGKTLIVVIGPKRMDYERVIDVVGGF